MLQLVAGDLVHLVVRALVQIVPWQELTTLTAIGGGAGGEGGTWLVLMQLMRR